VRIFFVTYLLLIFFLQASHPPPQFCPLFRLPLFTALVDLIREFGSNPFLFKSVVPLVFPLYFFQAFGQSELSTMNVSATPTRGRPVPFLFCQSPGVPHLRSLRATFRQPVIFLPLLPFVSYLSTFTNPGYPNLLPPFQLQIAFRFRYMVVLDLIVSLPPVFFLLSLFCGLR